MNLSKFSFDWKGNKSVVRWIIVGSVIIFIAAIFISSFIKYKTASTVTTYKPAYNEDEGFKRLYQDLTKDKPGVAQQKQALAEATTTNGQSAPVSPASVDEWVERGGWKSAPQHCDSLRVEFAMLSFAFGKLVEENEALKQQIASGQKKVAPVITSAASTGTRSGSPGTTSGGSNSSGGFDFSQYFNQRGSSGELTGNGKAGGGDRYSETAFIWATLSLPQKQQVRTESFISLNVDKAFTIAGVAVPLGSKVFGTAQVSQGVGRVYVNINRVETPTQTIAVEGEIYSLDRSRGINVFVHGESALAEGLKREASDWVGLLDPSRSGVSRNVLQDTDVGREYYANLDAGTMVLAKLRPRQ